jgi:two-component system sensor histidine kinase PilS (NtrC family)
LLSRHVRRLLLAGDSAQRRVYLTYLAVRAGLGLVLMVALLVQGMLAGKGAGPLMLGICLAYTLQAAVWWIWPGRKAARAGRWSRGHWWATVGTDAIAFGLLHWLDSTSTLNYGALLVLPVLMAGIVSERVAALATASAVTLMLLASALHKVLAGGDLTSLLSQAGMAGLGLFVIALVASQMSNRLAREERAARGSLELAHQQAELNRLVIDEMSDGVLVVDRRGRVRAANPAARSLLAEDGACPRAPFSLRDQPGWLSLLDAVESAYESGLWPATGLDLSVSATGEMPRSIRVRARFTRGASLPLDASPEGRQEVLAVLFAEELRSVLARQRQERLVAMGRISAGIAHEIRNPLAAVAQANALMQEDILRPDQQRLVRIIADNVDRLKRIVNDVLEAAPGGVAPSRSLDVCAEVSAIVSEWSSTAGVALGSNSRLQVRLPHESLGVSFDSDHLRRVLVNLLDNAMRHSTDVPGAVQISLEALEGAFVRLAVASDGPMISADVEPHLFEPFHSTRSRGTGLGLYICRELCERHGAIIDYVRHPGSRHTNVFLIVMRRDQIAPSGRLHL